VVRKLCTITAIGWAALAASPDRSAAQATHSVSISRHPSVAFSEQQADAILAAASKMLQKVDQPGVLACNLTLTRRGPIHTFASPNTPAVVRNASDLDAVHRENFDSGIVNIKIVKEIDYCRGQQGLFRGCSWPHNFESIVVTADAKFPELIWPHEFGHLSGLWHRKSFTRALMSPCVLTAKNVEVTQNECDCYLSGPGPGACTAPEPNPPVKCPPRH
jgi:hypothetical protein